MRNLNNNQIFAWGLQTHPISMGTMINGASGMAYSAMSVVEMDDLSIFPLPSNPNNPLKDLLEDLL